MKKFAIFTLSLIAFLTFIACSSPQDWFYKGPSFKGTSLEKKQTPKNTVFTPERLDSLTNYIKKNHNTTGMMVLQDGKIIYEYGSVTKINYIASCRKSILAMLYGKYVENGTIDLQETIGSIGIDEDDGLLPIEKEATVDHIITARSGVFHLPANGGYDEANVKERGSMKPGEYFLYNNWDFNVAGFILEEKSGNSIYKELEQQLAIPLGFEDWNIKNQKKYHNPEKSRYPAYHIYISTRDMAKIGQLMLNKGQWNGEQLISKDWIEKITATVTPAEILNARYGNDINTPWQQSYGYMWWLFDRLFDNPDAIGAYSATGAGGQFITVIPKLNMVVAHKTRIDLLTILNFTNNGVRESEYYRILDKLLTNRTSISELEANGKSVDEIISFISSQTLPNSEYDINYYGYKLMKKNRYEDALKIFKLNTELYPKSANTFDSYGECLKELGRIDESIKAYKTAKELSQTQ